MEHKIFSLTTRAEKGEPLTHDEMDANLELLADGWQGKAEFDTSTVTESGTELKWFFYEVDKDFFIDNGGSFGLYFDYMFTYKDSYISENGLTTNLSGLYKKLMMQGEVSFEYVENQWGSEIEASIEFYNEESPRISFWYEETDATYKFYMNSWGIADFSKIEFFYEVDSSSIDIDGQRYINGRTIKEVTTEVIQAD